MVRNVFVVLFVLSVLLLAGCKEDYQQAGKQSVDEPAEKVPLTVSSAPGPEEQAAQTEEPAGPEPEKGAPFCGDGICNGAENCDRCVRDCGCVSPAECYQGRCKVPECGSDGDCKDDSTCTVDRCYFAQHPNAYCAHEQIEKCRNSDRCCPAGCDANTDSDCKPVCGNHACEVGETEDSCEHDCPQQPDCGNQVCENGEDAKTCPRDCQ